MACLLKRLGPIGLLLHTVNSTVIPRSDEGNSQISSVLDPNVSLSFKETHICETTLGVKSYSGYVNIPADPAEGRSYDIHTFFWFFESRNDPANAPLSIWIQGGPGAPSMTAALGENGPCRVSSNSKDTVLNPWSWNNEVNMLYFDQPVQVGFSYDKLINGTVDEVMSPFGVTPQSPLGPANLTTTILPGIFSSQDPLSTANTTLQAALAAWHFMQTWVTEFPNYQPKDNKFSIWTESYGGHYGPTFSDFFESQNELIGNGSIDSSAVPLHLETVGIVNGCLDLLTQMPFYPVMAFNNTYGQEIINETLYQTAMDAWPTCRSMAEDCRSLAAAKDPLGTGTDSEVNTACLNANGYCFLNMWQPYNATGRNGFDLAASAIDPFPPKYAAGFMNSKEVQDDLGAAVNFTGLSSAVSTAFGRTGDFVLGRSLEILGELLDRGVKVALVYGDRDFQCNWLGGEQISLAIESKISADFHQAGYTEIKTNETYVGGMVRQYGNLSFSRVFDAGHEVPWYQPETAYQIFNRVMSDKDVATGLTPTKGCGKPYSSVGVDNVFSIKNDLPPTTKPECYFWDMLETCSKAQKLMFQNGTAIAKDFIMIGYELSNGTAVYY
ncbi:Alpha/Beta hydrolase protein [Xylariales sp. AK1849]|nr:Alpha/Beta hydrolase protein [Xylariales sp. AK1849]